VDQTNIRSTYFGQDRSRPRSRRQGQLDVQVVFTAVRALAVGRLALSAVGVCAPRARARLGFVDSVRRVTI
jgi:hypothetical protein